MNEATVKAGSGERASSALPPTFDALLSTVKERVDARLAAWVADRASASARISPEVGEVASAIAGLTLRGGKRLRAALVAAGFATRDVRDPIAKSESAMLAIELLQTYLLIHDDWMDDDDVRRGGPSVHVTLARRFGSKGAGAAAAILAGDLASGFAQEALLEADAAPERLVRAARVFARIQSDVVRGQVAEMRFGAASAAAAAEAVAAGPSVDTVYALKTATYTVTGPLLLGAALAGGSDAHAAALERFGRPLGVAFQLRDDLLGTFGDSRATGKPVGNDIRRGKRTALVTELPTEVAPLVARVLGRADASDADVAELVCAMVETGARSRVEARIRELCDEAGRALEAFGPPSGLEETPRIGRAWLGGAVTALGERIA